MSKSTTLRNEWVHTFSCQRTFSLEYLFFVNSITIHPPISYWILFPYHLCHCLNLGLYCSCLQYRNNFLDYPTASSIESFHSPTKEKFLKSKSKTPPYLKLLMAPLQWKAETSQDDIQGPPCMLEVKASCLHLPLPLPQLLYFMSNLFPFLLPWLLHALIACVLDTQKYF